MEKELGSWTNDGVCEAIGDDKSCGPGTQNQTRTCTNGTTDKCNDTDTVQTVTCSDAGVVTFPDCEKQLGSWINDGDCEAIGDDKACGPGNQNQTRTCTNGTTDKCNDTDTAQTVTCSDAGTTLTECAGNGE